MKVGTGMVPGCHSPESPTNTFCSMVECLHPPPPPCTPAEHCMSMCTTLQPPFITHTQQQPSGVGGCWSPPACSTANAHCPTTLVPSVCQCYVLPPPGRAKPSPPPLKHNTLQHTPACPPPPLVAPPGQVSTGPLARFLMTPGGSGCWRLRRSGWPP
jgi:hypothetical protein